MKIHDKEGKRQVPEWARLYMMRWVKVLTLNEWHITAFLRAADLDAPMGLANINHNTQRAQISLRHDIPDSGDAADLEEWQVTIIHELLHVRFDSLVKCVTVDILEQFGIQARQVAYDSFDGHVEQLIERLANILFAQEIGKVESGTT